MPDLAPPQPSLLARPRPSAPGLPETPTPPAPPERPSLLAPPSSPTPPRPAPLAVPTPQAPPTPQVPPTAPAAARRAFADPDAIRNAIYTRALAAARTIKPLENQRHILEVVEPRYEGPEVYDYAAQKKAILEGQSLERRLRADVVLRDKATGSELSRKTTTLAKIPFFTPRGTFIQNGVAYTLAHQFRLRGGAFTRRKQNGELEAHVNVLPGKGFAHRVHLDPETGRFELGMGQGAVPLMPVLKALGATDDQLREAWGDGLFAANRRKDEPSVLKAVAAKIRGDDALPAEEKLRKAFSGMALDPEVNRRTLGRPHESASPDLYLDITRKLLAINKGEARPDDRDHLAYMTIHGPEDLIAERIERGRAALQRPFWKASLLGKLDRFPAEVLTDAVRTALFSSGLGAPNEEVNPAMVLEQQGRVSRLGVGAIPSVDAVPDESRAVQPSFLGFVDPLVTPESMRAGVDSRIANNVTKGDDGRLYARLRDVRSGQEAHISAQDLQDKVVAFPGELKKERGRIVAIKDGRIRRVRREDVDFELPVFEDAFSPITNMVPGKSGVKGQRAVMAGRMITQALPLLDPEAPLVQSGADDDGRESYEEKYGVHMGALRSKAGGVVQSVEPGRITVRHDDGTVQSHDLYVHMPSNRKTGLHQTPTVQPGQRVEAGGLLARSNYTDGSGTTALGKNFRVAYLPAEGGNFEDAIAISESAAKRLTSEHYYQNDLDHEDGLEISRKAHISSFAGKYPKAVLGKLDDAGVIKVGETVKPGEPLALAVQERPPSPNQIYGGKRRSWVDKSLVWDHPHEGVVTDVARTKSGVKVIVKSKAEMELADKLSGRYGDKGTIGKIIPDDEMPIGADGKPFEVLVNDLGIITRTNPMQVVEAYLGKIAAKTGQPYKLADFRGKKLMEFAKAELARHGIPDTEDVIDPKSGAKIPGVLTGNRFFMKLHHTAESKGQGRGLAKYTSEGMPAKGGPEGAKRVSLLDSNAILSSGATAVLRDAGAVRGQAQPEMWLRFMAGHALPEPKVPQVYEKFFESLKAAGVNPVRQGPRTHLMAMTDKDVDELAGDRELTSGDTVDWEDSQKPVKGGLFDVGLTGGPGGRRWAKITLPEPMPNPAFEEPIRRVLGLTGKQFESVVAGEAELYGRKGPGAIAHALDRIDLDDAVTRARRTVQQGRGATRDAAARALGYLKAAQRVGIHPRQWMMTKVPVLPPLFRPVSMLQGSKTPIVADPNHLYKELLEARDNHKSLMDATDDLSVERRATYGAMKAVVGLGEPIGAKSRERGVAGILKTIFGPGGPKTGFVQRKLLGTQTDLVGRAVIAPDADLDMDSVGLPEDRAWSVYRPFIVRRLVRSGVPRMRAVQMIEGKEDQARKAMLAEMDNRPVILNRAPVLHRYGVMAFKPRLVKGSAMTLSPLVVKGFNADFDGDAMQYHVPAAEDAVKEAYEKMMPSRNLLSVNSFQPHMLPVNEFAGGLYIATSRRKDGEPARTFRTHSDAVRAYQSGEITIDTPVRILQDDEG